jgi:hypothetical protein
MSELERAALQLLAKAHRDPERNSSRLVPVWALDELRAALKAADLNSSDRPEKGSWADRMEQRWADSVNGNDKNPDKAQQPEDYSKNWTDFSFEHAAEDFPKGIDNPPDRTKGEQA